jgi:hypothetical protein
MKRPPTSKFRLFGGIGIVLGLIAIAAAFLSPWIQKKLDPPARPVEEVAVDIASRKHNMHSTPQAAIDALLAAYKTKDPETICAAKDFESDALMFWSDLKLPISESQLSDSTSAFRSNFLGHLKENGIRDYSDVAFTYLDSEKIAPEIVVITAKGTNSRREYFIMKLPVYRRQDGWIAVNLPGYDHL